MSIIEIPQRRLIDSDTYHSTRQSALGLFQAEEISPPVRRQMIVALLDQIYYGKEGDESAMAAAVSLTGRLLLSDPLTDQQAGAVARCLRFMSSPFFWEKDLEQDNRHLSLDPDEVIDIQAGDWAVINRIFGRYPERKSHWSASLSKMNHSLTPKTAYRMLELHPDDVATIRQLGMIPEGLLRHGSLESVIDAFQRSYWSEGSQPHSPGVSYLAENLFLSKANVLRENWAEWEFGAFSSRKLGLSTTTAENIRHRGAAFFGSYIFEIELPAHRLVAAPRDGLPEDERTVFFYIEPEAIKAVYQVEPLSPLTLWQQIKKQELPLTKRLSARFIR